MRKVKGRYSDINRGLELQDAYEKYQLWLKKTRAEKKTAYKAVSKPLDQRVKVERIPGYILPFNSQTELVYLETRIIAATQTGAGSTPANLARTLVADRVLESAPTCDNKQVISGKRYQFAKIIVSKRTKTATDEDNSRISGIPYKRHESDNASSAFGRKDATDNYSSAVKDIKANAAYTNYVKNVGDRIGFTPEGN